GPPLGRITTEVAFIVVHPAFACAPPLPTAAGRVKVSARGAFATFTVLVWRTVRPLKSYATRVTATSAASEGRVKLPLAVSGGWVVNTVAPSSFSSARYAPVTAQLIAAGLVSVTNAGALNDTICGPCRTALVRLAVADCAGVAVAASRV